MASAHGSTKEKITIIQMNLAEGWCINNLVLINLSFRTIATNLNDDASTVCRIINRSETTGLVQLSDDVSCLVDELSC